MGLELDGSKSFKTMAMDMHTVENGQIVFLDSFFCSSEQDARFLQSGICFNNFRTISRLNVRGECQGLKEIFDLMCKAFDLPAGAPRIG